MLKSIFLSKILDKNHHPGQESEDHQSTFYNHGSLWWSYWLKPYPNFYGSELLIIKGWSRKLARRYPPIPTWGGLLLRCWHYCQNISLWILVSRTEHPSDGRPRLSRAIPSTLPVLVVADGEDSASLAEHARFQCQKSATQIGATKKIEPVKPTWTLKPSLKNIVNNSLLWLVEINIVHQSTRSLGYHPACFLVIQRWLEHAVSKTSHVVSHVPDKCQSLSGRCDSFSWIIQPSAATVAWVRMRQCRQPAAICRTCGDLEPMVSCQFEGEGRD